MRGAKVRRRPLGQLTGRPRRRGDGDRATLRRWESQWRSRSGRSAPSRRPRSRRAHPGPGALARSHPGPRRHPGPGHRARPRLPRRVRLGRRWLLRGRRLLRPLGVPHHRAPRVRVPPELRDRTEAVLGPPGPAPRTGPPGDAGGVALYGFLFAPPTPWARSAAMPSPPSCTSTTGTRFPGQGYFAALNTPQPLLHTWSLSIEEQFYLVWPLVVLGVLRLTRTLRPLLGLTVAGAVASAVTMAVVYGNGARESRAYYGTDTRAQALLIGGGAGHRAGPSAPPPAVRRPCPTTALVRPSQPGPPPGPPSSRSAAPGWRPCSGWRIGRHHLHLDLPAAGSPWWPWPPPPSSPAWPSCPPARGAGPVAPPGAVRGGHLLRALPVPLADLRGPDPRAHGPVGWALFAVRVGCRWRWRPSPSTSWSCPVRRGLLRGWRGWVVTPLAVGATAVLVLGHRRPAPPRRSTRRRAPVGAAAPGPGTRTRPSCRRARRHRRPDPRAAGRRLRGQLPRLRAGPDSGRPGSTTRVTACSAAACCLLHRFHGTVVSAEGYRGGHTPCPANVS